jgi:hypothetical protein
MTARIRKAGTRAGATARRQPASPREIYRIANLLITAHGSKATAVATMRMNVLADRNDLDGAAELLSVVRAIGVLTSMTPEGLTH